MRLTSADLKSDREMTFSHNKNNKKVADNESICSTHDGANLKFPSRLVLLRLIGVVSHNFERGHTTGAKM